MNNSSILSSMSTLDNVSNEDLVKDSIVKFSEENSAQTEIFCSEWQGTHATLYQAGNAIFIIAFCVPHIPRFGTTTITRLLLIAGQIIFVFWSTLDICALDVFVWYCSLAAVNAFHAVYLVLKTWPPYIGTDLRVIYNKMFKSFKVSQRQFYYLSKDTSLKWLEAGESYAEEGVTPSDQQLAILAQGKMRVSCDKVYLHSISPNHFIDSIEWGSLEQDKGFSVFQVTVVAVEKCQILVWPQSKLKQRLETDPMMYKIMETLIGKDITMKLHSLNESGAGETFPET